MLGHTEKHQLLMKQLGDRLKSLSILHRHAVSLCCWKQWHTYGPSTAGYLQLSSRPVTLTQVKLQSLICGAIGTILVLLLWTIRDSIVTRAVKLLGSELEFHLSIHVVLWNSQWTFIMEWVNLSQQ